MGDFKKMDVFFDWLDVYQECLIENFEKYCKNGESVGVLKYEDGEFKPFSVREVFKSSSEHKYLVKISSSGYSISGNPAKYYDKYNTKGFKSVEDGFKIYDEITTKLGLPPLVRKSLKISDGNLAISAAKVRRIDITHEFAVGENLEKPYLKRLSQNGFERGVPRLHTNGCTVDWLTANGTAPLVYRSVYIKAEEMAKKFDKTPEVLAMIDEYKKLGILRGEIKIKGVQLKRLGCQYFSDVIDSTLKAYACSFFKHITNNELKKNLTSYDDESIIHLIKKFNPHLSSRAVNLTAYYFILWQKGVMPSLKDRQLNEYRSRLRRCGFDIFVHNHL